MRATSIFIAAILLVFISLSYISCEKEYSYEGGTAVFTLIGEDGNCTAPVINGIYSNGISLQSSNSVQLQVNVTTAGSYAFSTNVADGIQFKTSGNFATTGPQTVTLKGSGKPSGPGTFSFKPPVGAGCNFFITVQQSAPEVARFTLSGAPGSCTDFKINGTYTSGTTLISAYNSVELMVEVTTIGTYNISTDTIDGISFSAAGDFTKTGTQKVTLQGSGSPDQADNLTFMPNTGSSTCGFDLTVVTAGPPATYVLESNFDGSCTGYSVSGNYFSGEAMTSTNTMAVKVTVTVLGSYTIKTNTVNGMKFAATGSFVTLGSQIVVLTGTGTPALKGTFVFSPGIVGPHPIGGETCTTSIEVM